MSVLPKKVRLIWNRHCFGASEDSIVFNNYDGRIYRSDGFPDPVVIAVNINAEDPGTPGKPGFLNDRVDILAGNEARQSGKILPPVDLITSDKRNVILAPIDHQPAPVVINQPPPPPRLPPPLHPQLTAP